MLREIRERVADANIYRVYLTTFALGVAYGIALSVLAVHLNRRGFGKEAIGELAAAFALGIVALSLPMGALIRRFSAKNVLAASLFGYALTVGVFPLLYSYGAIAFVRFFDGACSVGVWVSSETILLARARREHKAYVTSLYAIAIAVGYIVGPLVARVATSVLPLELAFATSSAIALAAGVYALLRIERNASNATLSSAAETSSVQAQTIGGAGAPPNNTTAASTKTSAWRLLYLIKNSCFATFAYGYFQASVVLFLPLFLMESKGILEKQTILIPAFFAGGMLLFSNAAGRVGDRVGHLAVMRVLGVVGMTMIGSFVYLDSYAMMCAAVFVAGASLASISPVSLALQGVITSEYSRATAIYNAFYAGGMLLGPPISSRIFQAHGGAAMLFHLAAIWAVFVAFSIVFYRDDPAVQRRKQGKLLDDFG
jgi:MFS family permease